MALVEPILSLDDRRIDIFRSLKGKNLAKDGIFIAEGQRVVEALLNSNLEIVCALVTQRWLERLKHEFQARPGGLFPVYVIDEKAMQGFVGFGLHQGVIVAARMPYRLTLQEAAGAWPVPHLVVALDRIVDSENMGLILRNCLAFGVDALIVDKKSSDPYLRRSVRVSMGAVFKIPIVYADSLGACLETLRRKFKTQIIAASPNGSIRDLEGIDFSGNVCVVFGSEADGISEGVLNTADRIVRIPISKQLDSLNVACASAVFLYQAVNKRNNN